MPVLLWNCPLAGLPAMILLCSNSLSVPQAARAYENMNWSCHSSAWSLSTLSALKIKHSQLDTLPRPSIIWPLPTLLTSSIAFPHRWVHSHLNHFCPPQCTTLSLSWSSEVMLPLSKTPFPLNQPTSPPPHTHSSLYSGKVLLSLQLPI